MLNGTDPSPELGSSTFEHCTEQDESAYSAFFSTYNPNSPGYSNNFTDFGVQIALLKFCLEGVGVVSISALGILGNIASIIILSSKRMRNSSSCFLLCLAICDMLVLIGGTLLIGIPSLLAYDTSGDEKFKFKFNSKIAKYGNVIPMAPLFLMSITALSGSIFFTMALTLERYFAVCRPLTARSLCTWERASIISIIIFIFAILFNSPRWWEYTYMKEEINNFTIIRAVPTEMKLNHIYDIYYSHVAFVLVLFFFPIIFLIVFNFRIFRLIREANKMRNVLSRSQRNEQSLARLLFGVVAVFLICNLTPALLSIYRYAVGARQYVPEVEFLMIFMLILNCSVNCLIYCASGGKFRDVFCDTFCFWRRRRRGSGSTRTSRTFSRSSQFGRLMNSVTGSKGRDGTLIKLNYMPQNTEIEANDTRFG